MRFLDKLGLNATPLVLRLALGTVFVWAGSSKLLHSDAFPGERGARLAEMGIIAKPAGSGPVTPIVPESTPDPEPKPVPDEPEIEEPAKAPVEEPVKEPKPETPVADPNLPDPAPNTTRESGATPESEPIAEARSMMVILPARAQAATKQTESEADKPPRLKRLYGLVLVLDRASKPNQQGYILWPKFLSTPAWMERMAWAAALTEFIGGLLILLGLLTRPAALGIFGTMLTAMWLTQIGPSIGATGSFLGFLPNPEMSDPTKWNSTTSGWLMILWQFTLACVALGLTLSGAGKVSMDALIFRRGEDDRPKKIDRPVDTTTKRPV